MEGERHDASSSSSSSSSSSGIMPWGLLVLFSIFVLLFLPHFLSASFRGFRPAAIKSGWETLNFVLVLFAILCGVIGRGNSGGDDDDKPHSASSPKDWYSNNSAQFSYVDPAVADRAIGIRRMRSSSSYPDLRQEAAWGGVAVTDGWRCYDDTQLYRRRPESRAGESKSFREPAAKSIPVDTFVLRRSPSPRSRSPPSEPPPPPVAQRQPRRSFQKLPESLIEEDATSETAKSQPPPPRAQRLRRRSLEKLPESLVEEDAIFETGKSHPPPPPPPAAQPRHRRGRSLEKLPEMEMERDAKLGTRHRRSRTVDDLPNLELEQDWKLGVQKPHRSHPAPPPPPPPPPPPRSHKKRSGGGAKDLAAAISLFYQKKKKKGSKTKRSHEDLSIYLETSVSPPPPPPPPPSSVFRHLFSHKKSKTREIHSRPSAPPPPPPPLPSSWHYIKQFSPPPSPPPPPATRRSKIQAPLPPPTFPRASPQADLRKKKGKSNLSYFPLPPPSPLLPPPPPPPLPASDPEELFSENEEAVNVDSRRLERERGAEEGVAVFCPSPDVNNKAGLFIARFRAGLKLEKLNSIREKQQQQEEEIMMIGSLFDDDVISS